MTRRGVAIGIVAAAACASSCLVTADLERLDRDNGIGAPSEGGVDTGPSTPRDGASPGRCPVGMVTVDGVKGASGAFCVDAFETTVADYLAFLATTPDPTKQEYPCKWNESFAPSRSGEGCATYDASAANMDAPIVCVDWCDARAFCEAAGKRLCGSLDATKPGNVNPLGARDFETSEWYAACSAAGAKVYPYGDEVDVAACVARASSPQAKSMSSCEGGYEGIHDMSGNVAEWDNTCESGPDPKADGCRARGGAFWAANDPAQPNLLRCDAVQGGGRSGTYNDRGFRCCKTP